MPKTENLPNLYTKGLRMWAVCNARTGALRMRAVPGTADDWQAKVYSTKKIAMKYAWPDEMVMPVDLVERPGKKQRGQ